MRVCARARAHVSCVRVRVRVHARARARARPLGRVEIVNHRSPVRIDDACSSVAR